MTPPDTPPADMARPDDASGEGAFAPAGGTPVPVDVSADRRVRLTWVAFLAGPTVWFTHFMVVYLVAEAGCTGGGPGLRLLDPPAPVVVTLVATVLAAALCAAAAAWAFARWQESRRTLEAAPDAGQSLSGEFDDDHRRGALGFAGFLLSSFSVLAVLFTGAPALFLGPC